MQFTMGGVSLCYVARIRRHSISELLTPKHDFRELQSILEFCNDTD